VLGVGGNGVLATLLSVDSGGVTSQKRFRKKRNACTGLTNPNLPDHAPNSIKWVKNSTFMEWV